MGKKKGGVRYMRKAEIIHALVDLFKEHQGEVLDVKYIWRALSLTTHPAKMLCMDALEEMRIDDYIREAGYGKYALCAEVRTKKDNKKSKPNDRRVAEMPERRFMDIMDRTGVNNAEVNAVMTEYGLPPVYPKAVEEAADRIPVEIPEEEILRRLDMRDVLTFTIDPHDAKDFDDALSIRTIQSPSPLGVSVPFKGNRKGFRGGATLYEIGVHIADVSHYVTENSIIDREALKRGTSVYLVDRTIPMLPECLCNNLCSLRPDEDKLTYSVIFRMDSDARVLDWKLKHTVIRSNRRFCYEQVQKIFEDEHVASEQDYNAPGDYLEPLEDHEPTTRFEPGSEERRLLIVMNDMAKKLRERRFQNGAVDFDRSETRFMLDDKGHPTGVYFKVAKDANKLVEEFMLLANRTVAESIGKVPRNQKPKVLPYRIHESPDPAKLANLSQFVRRFGYRIKTAGTKDEISKNLNRMLSEAHGTAAQNVVEMVTLRAMMKARYSVHNEGHYGLAFDYYTHFTSPIRRYPDLMVHRLLTRYAEGGRSVSSVRYEELCDQCSEAEQTAAAAERASIKYKQVEYMRDHLGETYQGTISSVTEFGLFIEINENKCEGFVSMRDLDDYYEFDEKNLRLIGRHHHHCYNLGDQVTVQIAQADLFRKQLDFKLIKN